MGLMPSNKPVASRPTTTGDNPGIIVNPGTVKDPDEKLTERKYVDDTMHNRVGVNTYRRSDVINDLKGFAEGSVFTCTYYKNHYSETDIGGRVANTEGAMNNVHKSVLRIDGFEMRMVGSLQYEFDTEQNLSKLSGEAMTYPFFEPESGDMFIMDLGDGKYGQMVITGAPVRTSIRASTYFKIQFKLKDWMNVEEKKILDDAVTDTAVFDKQRFLAEPGALLRHDEYNELKYLEKQRSKMVQYFNAKFLDETTMYSYMRPDGLYDPYVMDFVQKTFDYQETGTLAVQLFEHAPFIETSFWSALLEPTIPLEAVPSSTNKAVYKLGSKTVLATSLINKEYIYAMESKSLKEYLDGLINAPTPTPAPAGTLPADSTIPTIGEADTDKELGDLLLHLHPHYSECPYVNGSGGGTDTCGAGDCIQYMLGTTTTDKHFQLVSNYLLNREIKTLAILHELIANVWKLTPIEQFYKMPVYIYLARVTMNLIHHTDGVFDR